MGLSPSAIEEFHSSYPRFPTLMTILWIPIISQFGENAGRYHNLASHWPGRSRAHYIRRRQRHIRSGKVAESQDIMEIFRTGRWRGSSAEADVMPSQQTLPQPSSSCQEFRNFFPYHRRVMGVQQ